MARMIFCRDFLKHFKQMYKSSQFLLWFLIESMILFEGIEF